MPLPHPRASPPGLRQDGPGGERITTMLGGLMLKFLLGAAVGYVLGARAGHERYEQLVRTYQRIWTTRRCRVPPGSCGPGSTRSSPGTRTPRRRRTATAADAPGRAGGHSAVPVAQP